MSGLDGAWAASPILSTTSAAAERDPARSMRIYLLGAPRIEWAGSALVLPRRQCRALLFRLAASPDALPREGLQFLFWPDLPDAEARRNLTHLLTHLRRNLPDADLVSTPGDRVALDPARTWVDVREFVRLCAIPEPVAARCLAPGLVALPRPFHGRISSRRREPRVRHLEHPGALCPRAILPRSAGDADHRRRSAGGDSEKPSLS